MINRELIAKYTRDKICKQHRREALFMCECAQSVEQGVIVEVGRWKGASMALMAEASPSSHVHSIDNNDKHNDLAQNLSEGLSNYTIIDGDSQEVAKTWTQEIDMLFVDAFHYKDFVLMDLESWVPKVKVGGLILMHDYFTKRKSRLGRHWKDGVRLGLRKFNSRYKNLEKIEVVRHMILLRKIRLIAQN